MLVSEGIMINIWEKLKKYLYIDSAIRKKYADSALKFEYKALLVLMRIIIFLFPIYGTVLFVLSPQRTRAGEMGLVSTFVYSLFSYICIDYIRKKKDHHHVNAMRILYSLVTIIYLYVIGTLMGASYILIYMVLLFMSICFINPIEYKLLVVFSLIAPDLVYFYLTDTSHWEDIYYLLDTLVVSLGAVIINQFYAADRYRLFALERRLRCDRDIDGLTGLSNKRCFQEMMEEGFDSSGLGCAILVDLDHFKEVNDTFGHERGDDVLQKAAQILQSVFREDDSLSRIGGDEFAAFFVADVSAERMEDIVKEKIRILQKETPIIVTQNQETVEVTFSIGVCIRQIDDEHTPQDILAEADAAMYQIKNSTRNGACLQNAEDPEAFFYLQKNDDTQSQ